MDSLSDFRHMLMSTENIKKKIYVKVFFEELTVVHLLTFLAFRFFQTELLIHTFVRVLAVTL